MSTHPNALRPADPPTSRRPCWEQLELPGMPDPIPPPTQSAWLTEESTAPGDTVPDDAPVTFPDCEQLVLPEVMT